MYNIDVHLHIDVLFSLYVTRAGKMSQYAYGLILSYRQKKWKMFIKSSSSDPNAPNSKYYIFLR